MEDHYGQFDDSIHLALQEIRNEVMFFTDIEKYSEQLLAYKSNIEYMDDGSLVSRLNKFDPFSVIKHLDILVSLLSNVDANQINAKILDEKDFDNEMISREEDRNYLLKKKNNLQTFIEGLKQQFSNIAGIKAKTYSGIKYQGATRKLEDMKKILIENRFIKEADDLVDIFTDKPFVRKIDWAMNGNLLYYFIEQLYQQLQPLRLIKENGTRILSITNSFTLDGKDINNKKFKDNHRIKESPKTKIIDRIIEVLKS